MQLLLFAATLALGGCDDPIGSWEPSPPTRFSAVSAGDDHTCAIAEDQTLWCWGRMSIARLGFASNAFPCDGEVCVRPVPVYGGARVSELSAGGEHSCAVALGGAYCWGYAYWGQLGDARSVYQRCPTPHAADPLYCSIEPFPVAIGKTIVDVAAGSNHSCVVASDGDAYCFGLNQFRQTGTGSVLDSVIVPAPVTGNHAFRDVTAGMSHTCAIDTEDHAWCWGANSAGTLGDNQYYGQSDVPVAVIGDVFSGGQPLEWKSLDAGIGHNCGVVEGDTAWCWGLGGGRLGRSDPFSWPAPVRVQMPNDARVLAVSAGGTHSCAIAPIGTLYCFGENGFGQIGDGSAQTQLLPARVPFDGVITSVSAGARHTCAIDLAGQVWCWGNNDWGQLGTGDRGHRATPARVGA